MNQDKGRGGGLALLRGELVAHSHLVLHRTANSYSRFGEKKAIYLKTTLSGRESENIASFLNTEITIEFDSYLARVAACHHGSPILAWQFVSPGTFHLNTHGQIDSLGNNLLAFSLAAAALEQPMKGTFQEALATMTPTT